MLTPNAFTYLRQSVAFGHMSYIHICEMSLIYYFVCVSVGYIQFNGRVNCESRERIFMYNLQYSQLRQMLEVGFKDHGDVVALQVSEKYKKNYF